VAVAISPIPSNPVTPVLSQMKEIKILQTVITKWQSYKPAVLETTRFLRQAGK
jgi:hypothetical protein